MSGLRRDQNPGVVDNDGRAGTVHTRQTDCGGKRNSNQPSTAVTLN